MRPINYFKLYLYLMLLGYCAIIFISITTVYSIESDEVLLTADKMSVTDDGNKISAEENIYIQTNELVSSADIVTYDKKKNEFIASGNVSVLDKLGNNYYFDTFISDKDFNTALGNNVKIRMNDGARIVGDKFSRINSNTNQINSAIYTPCSKENYAIKNCPGWKLNSKKVIHDSKNKTLYYENAVLSIMNVPILYTPYFSHPDPSVKKRTGLLMPKITSDNVLGTSFSLPFFYNIASNKDFTITPTIQTKADDYYTLNYRHLSKNHRIDLDASITSNESDNGTKNHLFIDGKVENPYGEFDYKVQNSNNDTYLRKNHINDLTVHTSGLSFTKENKISYLAFNTYAYKHLNNVSNEKWEYVYPNINFNIHNYNDPIFNRDWVIENSFLNYRNIQKNSEQQISNEIKNIDLNISNKTGLKFENTIQNRLVYTKKNVDNFSQLRLFPQISSKISYPMNKTSLDFLTNQTLEPIVMPILAPYNNYTNQKNIDSSSLFSLNRASSLTEWESGPRVNYGINWLINSETININTLAGQSLRINKDKNSTDDEISNFFIGNTIDINEIGYINTDLTLEKNDLYVKNSTINSVFEYNEEIKFAFDYVYETENKITISEQISAGTKLQITKDVDIIASLRKDLMNDKSFGNALGIHYENDCLAINFDYFKDFTVVDDIKNSRGFSFTVILKPFGSTKNYGKVKNFGPSL